jgi:hypothetical protein
MKRIALAAALSLIVSCASTGNVPRNCPCDESSPVAVAQPKPAAPWSNSRLKSSDVPAVYFTEQRKADNRAKCAVLAPLSVAPDAKPRSAYFGGGWGIAYDQPGQPGSDANGYDCATCGRSAFGVAGAGVEPGGPTYQWENNVEYADGSHVGYGLQGGSGPGWLAYIIIPGQGCMYNVWSHIGREHLEELISKLRFVE